MPDYACLTRSETGEETIVVSAPVPFTIRNGMFFPQQHLLRDIQVNWESRESFLDRFGWLPKWWGTGRQSNWREKQKQQAEEAENQRKLSESLSIQSS